MTEPLPQFDINFEDVDTATGTSSVDENYHNVTYRWATAQVTQFEKNIKEREKYAGKIYRLIVVWFIFLGCIVILQGITPSDIIEKGFKLSDTVLLALIGSTTANVLGILFVVLKYLFPEQQKK